MHAMSLEQSLTADIVTAMKAKDVTRLTALRMLKTALTNKSIEKGRALGGRGDLADKEQAEIAVLDAYLPASASDDEIAAAVASAVAETGATSARDMGKVMKAAMAGLAGKTVDGKKVSEAVKASLK
jgi:uncharacterized protein